MADQNGSTSTRRPLLDISTIVPRDFVRIDGETYDVVSPGQKGIRWELTTSAIFGRCREIEALGTAITEADATEYDAKLRELTALIVPDLPPAVLDVLTLGQRTGIIAAFFVSRATESSRAIDEATEAISANSSHDSLVSTASANGS